jgi:hypothetical protein
VLISFILLLHDLTMMDLSRIILCFDLSSANMSDIIQ